MDTLKIIEKIISEGTAEKAELAFLLGNITDEERGLLRETAQSTAQKNFGNKVYVRGLIEFSSICKNDCLYCGLRRSNKNAVRYRYGEEDILACADRGYELGFRTFVLQGGEDGFYTDEVMCGIIASLKSAHPDCAVTLSLGERSFESYRRLFDAGADRYLLRHETADRAHYQRLHPPEMSFDYRRQSLYELKKIGYQTGAGFMVGSPYQTNETLAEDLLFIKELSPQMCGIGPFIPHKDTPFGGSPRGSLELTLTLLSLIRIMNPKILLPATTALGTIDPRGRELGILHGANVVMPNLSPREHRADYSLYDDKICTGDEAAECVRCLGGRISFIGYQLDLSRGDYRD